MANFKQLLVWKEAIEFAKEVYENLNGLSDYGLKSQITRSAVSIASNVAEGSERDSDPDFVRFLRIAKASSAECRTQLKIAELIGVLPAKQYEVLDKKAEILTRRISCLIKYLLK